MATRGLSTIRSPRKISPIYLAKSFLLQEVCVTYVTLYPLALTAGLGVSGLDKALVIALAKSHPKHICIGGNSGGNIYELFAEVKAHAPHTNLAYLEINLGSLSSVQAAAKHFVAVADRLDIFICNTGIIHVGKGTTKDEYSNQLRALYLGRALLIKLLMPTMLHTAEALDADVRIVCATTAGYASKGTFKKLTATEANIVYATELARQYPQVTTVCIEPPENKAFSSITDSTRSFLRPEELQNRIWAAVGPKSGIKNGGFYEPVGKLVVQDKLTRSGKEQARLWEWTEKELRPYTK